MPDGEVISVSSGEDQQDHYVQRRAILEPAILNVVNALGGYEGGEYRLGDEVYGCLKDLKKFWRKDDADDERTVARILWASRVLPNDLVPIILETAGKGHVEDKRAVACTDLITAMTWPIDLAEELKELDEELDRGTDYTQLLQSHLHYKAALLRPGVLQALFSIILPCLARGPKTRTERDVQIVNVVLHLVRNLAFIKDLPPNVHLSADQAEFASLQSKLIRTLSESHFFDLLLTIASSAATDTAFNSWNALVLEIIYLLFRGAKPTHLVLEQSAQTKQDLRQLLTVEDRRRRDFARNAPSRHSRFGTTISVRLNPKKVSSSSITSAAPSEANAGIPISPDQPSCQPLVLHRQQALSQEPGAVIDLVKRHNKQKGKKEDEVARSDNLTPEARTVLRGVARTFIVSCFNTFLASLLKDIKSERPKITEKDNLRLLFVTKWFLEYFLAVQAQEKGVDASEPWAFGLVGEVIERSWIVWVLKRMSGAVEEKPKLWTELQAGIECLTQLLALLEAMASTSTGASGEAELHEAALLLQQQIVYNGQVLDAALDSLRMYKDGTQSLTFLRSSVHLAYALFRMLEKWAKTTGDGSYVRKRRKPKRKQSVKAQNAEEPDGVPDVEEEEQAQGQPEDEVIEETMFTFESFELKFANSDITQSLLTYIGRHKEFVSPEEMKRVVSLLHRQAVRAKAEGLFFQVSTLNLFKTILADRKSFPKDQPYKDLVALMNYVLRQFFKAVEADPFVLVEAFFPKNRNRWKRHSSWEPESKSKSKEVDPRFPPDVQVKKGFTWSEQLAIAMAALKEARQNELIEWVKEILTTVIAQRRRIEERANDPAPGTSDDEGEDIGKDAANHASDIPQTKTAADYTIPYTTDAQADAATRNPQLKLVFRLVHFHLQDEDADELEWYIPAGIEPSDLQLSLAVIERFEKAPLELNGRRASQLLCKKRRRGRRRRRRRTGSTSPGSEGESGGEGDDVPGNARKKARERETYKSAQFIEDSEEEYGRDIDEFFAREAELRRRTALAAASENSKTGTMRQRGTRKRGRAHPPLGSTAKERAAKRRKAVVLSSCGTPGGTGEGERVHEHGDNAGTRRDGPSPSPSIDDDGGGGEEVDDGNVDKADVASSPSRSSLADREVDAGSLVRARGQVGGGGGSSSSRPKARPRYHGAHLHGSGTGSDEEDESAILPLTLARRTLLSASDPEGGLQRSGSGDGGGGEVGVRKGRLIISDEE
ncbi:timeless-domain-containing protein [Russula earlei]|uniref:Timeless-domain-containing protein n=1 Tax=Russula earlei TaxID=71964 RepID=A0ACC0U7P4_9AGAM|nr:timeless-domain-containing protein [Russula earlei]